MVRRAFGIYRLPSLATGMASRSVSSLRSVWPGAYLPAPRVEPDPCDPLPNSGRARRLGQSGGSVWIWRTRA